MKWTYLEFSIVVYLFDEASPSPQPFVPLRTEALKGEGTLNGLG
jgi:hypothetical protein